MTVLELRFPAGRFHATPWGRHVNEGGVEWPPSPWRLLRSLLATWYLKARTEVSEETIRKLLTTLSAQMPAFHLPPAANGHTRHFMPVIEGAKEKKTKVFDTFIQLSPNDAVLIAWDVTLPPDQLAALRILAARLGYFGRAESLVEATVRDDIAQIRPNALPLAENEKVPSDGELVRLLSPLSSIAHEKWLADFIAKNPGTDEILGKPAKKKAVSKKAKGPTVPSDLFTALGADTGELQAAGWNLPPGAVWVNYIRPADAFAPVTRTKTFNSETKHTVARYAVVSSVAPRIIDSISVANRVHQSLCSYLKDNAESARIFTGLDTNKKPLAEHRHAHIFCEANGERDAITHITVWAAMGFDEAACLALRRLTKVWGHGGYDIRLVLHGIGNMEDFKGCALFEKERVWRSLTPFVSTRHAKTFRDGRPKMAENGWQEGSAAHDLLRLLELNPNWRGVKIRKQLEERERPFGFGERNERRFRSLQFQTLRHGGNGLRGHDSGAAFIIEFPKPVNGPIAAGYGSHFGLGLFVPA
jgi:CRISPR-associated protein Csb2